MVKAKRKTSRQKAEKAAEKQDVSLNHNSDKLEVETVRSVAKTKPWDVRSDIFKDVEVGSAIVKDRLENFDDADAKTIITSKSFRGLNIRKKDKRKIKQNLLKQKISLIKEAKEALKARKKREKTVIVGDMKPIADSLPTVLPNIERYLAESGQKKHDHKPSKEGFPTQKRRMKQQMTDINLFQQVLKHPEYQKNPTGTIQEHLNNKLILENQKNTMDTTN